MAPWTGRIVLRITQSRVLYFTIILLSMVYMASIIHCMAACIWRTFRTESKRLRDVDGVYQRLSLHVELNQGEELFKVSICIWMKLDETTVIERRGRAFSYQILIGVRCKTGLVWNTCDVGTISPQWFVGWMKWEWCGVSGGSCIGFLSK